MAQVLGHECLSHMAANFPTFTTIGTSIANECGLKVVLADSTLSRCTRLQGARLPRRAAEAGTESWLTLCASHKERRFEPPDVMARSYAIGLITHSQIEEDLPAIVGFVSKGPGNIYPRRDLNSGNRITSQLQATRHGVSLCDCLGYV